MRLLRKVLIGTGIVACLVAAGGTILYFQMKSYHRSALQKMASDLCVTGTPAERQGCIDQVLARFPECRHRLGTGELSREQYLPCLGIEDKSKPAAEPSAIGGCSGEDLMMKIEARLAREAPVKGYRESSFEGRQVFLAPDRIFSVQEARQVELLSGVDGKSMIRATFPESVAKRLEKETGSHIGGLLAIVVEGQVEQLPKINAAITGGSMLISLKVPSLVGVCRRR